MADERLRILFCKVCKTYEEFAFYDGPPERDEELALRASKHQSAGVQHVGALFDVLESEWGVSNKREEIKKAVVAKLHNGETGLDSSAYAMVNNFKDDAFACFERHQRNPACPDYRSESKRLIPDTDAERREMGLAPAREYDRNPNVKTQTPTIYLCNYCPVESIVATARRKKAGLYDGPTN
jgi:hypothetical protein